jgi:hypothetical protein
MAETKGIHSEITTEKIMLPPEVKEEVKEALSSYAKICMSWKPPGSVPAPSSCRPPNYKGAR